MVLPDDYGVGEMQIIVVSNSPSKRIEYFVEAGRSLQTGVRFMTYEELFNCLPSLRQAVVQIGTVGKLRNGFSEIYPV